MPGGLLPDGRCHGGVGAPTTITQNQSLYALIGSRFGGNGRTTFALPDLRGKAPADGSTYCIALQGIFPRRS